MFLVTYDIKVSPGSFQVYIHRKPPARGRRAGEQMLLGRTG